MNHELCDHNDIDIAISAHQGDRPIMFRWVLSEDEADYATKVMFGEDDPPLNLDYRAALNYIDIVTATGHTELPD